MMRVDLNADLGEGLKNDAEMMPLITSANVCCGLHAGDPDSITKTLDLARRHQVCVGAHPGYADREHFGRRDLTLSASEVRSLLHYQLGGLDGLARGLGIAIKYVKPHGALYNQACRDEPLARAVCSAIYPWGWPIVGLPNSALQRSAQALKIRFIAEGFADRRYQSDGSLVPRSEPNSIILDPIEAVEQVLKLLQAGMIQTICFHGDHPHAVAFASAVRAELLARNVILQHAV